MKSEPLNHKKQKIQNMLRKSNKNTHVKKKFKSEQCQVDWCSFNGKIFEILSPEYDLCKTELT